VFEKALEFFNKALDIQLSIHGENHPVVATIYTNMGLIYQGQGKSDQALANHNKALNIRLAMLGENHPDVAQSYNSLFLVYYAQGNYEKALEYKGGGRDLSQILHEQGVISIRFSGPLFFGDALDVTKFLQKLKSEPKIIIIRMGYVPMVDISGANALVSFISRVKKKNDTKIILSNVKKQPRRMLHEAFLQNNLDWHNIAISTNFENALKITRRYLRMKKRQEQMAK